MANGIGPTPASMFGSLGLEVRDSKNCQLIWKTVNKGKRSKKSVIRNSNGLSKLSIESPVRVGDFSVSDSKKYVGSSTWPNLSNESVRVPLKKRQHILLSSSLYEDLNPLSIQRSVIDESNDFSGIVLLAATACNIITEESDNVKGGVMESGVSISCSASCLRQNVDLQLDDKKCQCFPEASYANQIGDDNNLCTLMEACKEKRASFNCIQMETIHRDEEFASTSFDCKSSLNDVRHMAPGPTDDPRPTDDTTASFILKVDLHDDSGTKHSEHQMEIFEVTGLEVSEHKNDIQMKDEEHFQKAFEFPENGITVGDGLLRETSNTVVETSGTTSKSECIVTLDEGLVSDVLQESIKLDGSDKLDASEIEGRVQLDNSTQNIYDLEMDCDSPYEDGELRGSVLYSCVENELKDGEHEYDYESDVRVDDDLNTAHYPGPETSLGINKELEGNMENIETKGKKNVPNLVDEFYPPMGLKKQDDGSGKRKCPFEKLQSCTKGNSSGRFGKVDISRTDREISPDGHVTRITRYGSSSYKYGKTEGNNKYWDSRHGNYFRSRGMDHHLPRFRNEMAEEKYQPFNKDLKFLGAKTKAMKIQNNRRGKNSENYRGVYFNRVRDDAEHVEWRTPRSRWGSPKFRPEAYLEKTRGPFQKPKFNDRYSEDFVSSPGHVHNNRFVHKPYGDMFFRHDQRLLDSDERARRFPVDSNSRSNGKQDERHRKRYADDVSPNSRCSRFLNRDTYGKSFISPPPRTRWATNKDTSVINHNLSSHKRSPIESFRPKSNDYLSQSKRDVKFAY